MFVDDDVSDAIFLPMAQDTRNLSTDTSPWAGEAKDSADGFDVHQSCEPILLWLHGPFTDVAIFLNRLQRSVVLGRQQLA